MEFRRNILANFLINYIMIQVAIEFILFFFLRPSIGSAQIIGSSNRFRFRPIFFRSSVNDLTQELMSSLGISGIKKKGCIVKCSVEYYYYYWK